MKNQRDNFLLLRLMNKTYQIFAEINQNTDINWNLQLYNHNKQIIIDIFGLLYKEISSAAEVLHKKEVMGNSYLNFIENCKK